MDGFLCSFFLLVSVALLKSTEEEGGSNDRIVKWFSSYRNLYMCVGYPVEVKQQARLFTYHYFDKQGLRNGFLSFSLSYTPYDLSLLNSTGDIWKEEGAP
jgi:hypothetical protein